MKIGKIIIMFMLFICLSSMTYAITTYSIDEIVTIDAQYTASGVLTHANANLTVTLPNDDVDLLANNIALNESPDGVFNGQYTTQNITGTYKALVVFYDDSGSELGRDVRYFAVSAQESLSIFFYPAFIIIAGLVALAFATKNAILGIFGGLGVVFLSFMLTGAFFIITLVGGLIIMLSMLLMQSD